MTKLSTRSRAMTALVSAVMAVGLLGATATAPDSALAKGGQQYRYGLDAVPHDPAADGGSDASGRAKITLKGDRVTVKLHAKGFSPGLAHAQHIHGVGNNECPGPDRRDDRVDDGLIDTVEGLPDYGAVQVSLTTSGDTSADSTLALDRFPVADKHGKIHYKRTFTVGVDFPESIASDLVHHHIVMHGIDVDHNNEYDFHLGSSGLGAGVPLEAELPADCGVEKSSQ